MADKPPASSLLQRLRQQSDAVRANESPRRSVEEILLDMDQRLWRAYRWLDEALAHLGVIKPVVAHDFRVESYLTLSGLQFEQGFVSYRRRHLAGQELLDYVEMFYRLSATEPVKLRVQPTAVSAVDARLRTAGMTFRYEPELDERKVITAGRFAVTPAVTGTVRFNPDYRLHGINVRLTNVDRFETVDLEFKPEQVDEGALEDLVRLMLGESNAFLRRAPLAGVGAGKKPAAIDEPVVYRIEKTIRSR
ncbi:MAG: hypothetical protein BroJett026_15400 [Betaproteobacteria bacterium]|nr:MAG: hypothetical protein BroJett026_15400 [Betaproteobacteria bacterium]